MLGEEVVEDTKTKNIHEEMKHMDIMARTTKKVVCLKEDAMASRRLWYP